MELLPAGETPSRLRNGVEVLSWVDKGEGAFSQPSFIVWLYMNYLVHSDVTAWRVKSC